MYVTVMASEMPKILMPSPHENHSHGKMFWYLFFSLFSSATTVDEAVAFSIDCGWVGKGGGGGGNKQASIGMKFNTSDNLPNYMYVSQFGLHSH